ncbi:hypothetical protein H0X90_21630 [Burkholderia sp. 9775_39]|uniref:hypothetical protein n=1 Tax=unclassified Burkholderia TaxID=2613784 RepID=UPI0018C3793E|nr:MULTISPECIES: hypothetical protein [unclassified Burkholderia]MBG0879394.1 hypothetical protein [Burkholderia sp. 9775_39]MBG0884535.1 hypothetical protein [Burkholderia sp. 9773_38]
MDEHDNERRFGAIEQTLTELIERFNSDRTWLVARLDSIEGQLLALQAATRALIHASPDPENAVRCVGAEIERLSVTTLHSANSDAFLLAIETAKQLVLRKPPTAGE